MKIKKIEEGLLEHYNYFLHMPLTDIVGNGRMSRDEKEVVVHGGRVERPFNYEEFVIIVNKENANLSEQDSIRMYTRIDGRMYGIDENGKSNYNQSDTWKIIRYEDYIQAYAKKDGQWENIGGTSSSLPIAHQGFEVNGESPLTIKDYKVYSSPYITLYDVPEGYSANVVGLGGEELLEKRFATIEGLIELYVIDPVEGMLVLYDTEGEIALKTELMPFKYGDKFSIIPHDLELRYRGRVLDYKPTRLEKRRELVYLYNTSDIQTYDRIVVSVFNPNVDNIEISLDNENFGNEVYIQEIKPNHQREIFIRIKRQEGNSFRMRKFALEIDEY